MAISTFERNATIAEMAVEIDRRGAAIERLEAAHNTLTAALAASEAKRKDAETRVQFAKDELAAIASLIKDNIVENGRPGDGIVIKGERHTGPVVDFTFRVLRGIQQIATNSVIALDQPKTEDAASDDGDDRLSDGDAFLQHYLLKG